MATRRSLLSRISFKLFGDYPNILKELDKGTTLQEFMDAFSKAVEKIKLRHKTAVVIFTVGGFRVSYSRTVPGFDIILGEKSPTGRHAVFSTWEEFLKAITLTPKELKSGKVTAKELLVVLRFRKLIDTN